MTPSKATLCLLIACLMPGGCAPSVKPLPLRTPPLAPSLAQPCPALTEPPVGSYDLWQDWMQNEVLRKYGLCAARHAAIVTAWPR